MSGPLAGKRALVTGAASGIGRAIAIALAREGACVALADRAPLEQTEAVVGAIAAEGGSAFAAAVDVAEEAAVLALFQIAIPRLGGLDILVNNAGILIEKPLLDTTAHDFDSLVGVNLRGSFLVGREAIRVMVSEGGEGRVINIASELAYLGRENCSLYCASKGGVLSMTRSWAREFAPRILVNAIAPGPTDTPLLGIEFTSPETLAKESQNPLGRIARPEEIAGAAVFLAGPAATFMTGQCVSPNGGAAMF
jgi:3-oxoacyl-[acyl-carrier protein] reductase